MSRSLRVLLFAHHQVGVSAFHALREAGHEVQACFTHPQREAWAPSLSAACQATGVPCSEDMPQPAEAQRFRDVRPDLIVSAGYRRRVGLPFLALPRWGSINAHLAPLPGYRGASPIAWGILNGETAWGVTIHAMTHNYNEGGVLRRQPVSLRESDNAYDLFLRCSQIACRALSDTVAEIAGGGGDLLAQDLRDVRFYEAGAPHIGRIDWNQSAATLSAFVRATDFGRGAVDGVYEHLAPPAMALLAGEEVGIWRARAGGTASPYPPGTITRCDREVWVQTGRGHLVIERICDAAGRDWVAVDYLNARGIGAGETFDARHAWRTAHAARLGYAA